LKLPKTTAGLGELVESDHPCTLDGGAAERMAETTGRRLLALVEA